MGIGLTRCSLHRWMARSWTPRVIWIGSGLEVGRLTAAAFLSNLEHVTPTCLTRLGYDPSEQGWSLTKGNGAVVFAQLYCHIN